MSQPHQASGGRRVSGGRLAIVVMRVLPAKREPPLLGQAGRRRNSRCGGLTGDVPLRSYQVEERSAPLAPYSVAFSLGLCGTRESHGAQRAKGDVNAETSGWQQASTSASAQGRAASLCNCVTAVRVDDDGWPICISFCLLLEMKTLLDTPHYPRQPISRAERVWQVARSG